MQFISSILFALMLILAGSGHAAQPPRAAIVLSSAHQAQGKAGFDLEELAKTYLVLRQHGAEVDLFSPAGGALPVHQHKDKLPHIRQFKEATPALAQLAATLPTSALGGRHYAAILVMGGDGAMHDLGRDPALAKAIGRHAAAGKPVAAVCHGVAALLAATDADGTPLVRGKVVTAFSDREETLFGKGKAAKAGYSLEASLKALGARYRQAPALLPYVAEDGALITAQNPLSIQLAVRRVVARLGLPLQPELHFADEASMALAAHALGSGVPVLDQALQTNRDRYDADWLMLYAFHAPRDSYPDQQKAAVLELAERIAVHFPHPELLKGLARLKQNKAE